MLRLNELRKEKALSQRTMAQKFNISQATYNNWENGNTQPSIEQLISLADFFDVTVDYLIGRTEDNLELEPLNIDSDEKEGQIILSFPKNTANPMDIKKHLKEYVTLNEDNRHIVSLLTAELTKKEK